MRVEPDPSQNGPCHGGQHEPVRAYARDGLAYSFTTLRIKGGTVGRTAMFARLVNVAQQAGMREHGDVPVGELASPWLPRFQSRADRRRRTRDRKREGQRGDHGEKTLLHLFPPLLSNATTLVLIPTLRDRMALGFPKPARSPLAV